MFTVQNPDICSNNCLASCQVVLPGVIPPQQGRRQSNTPCIHMRKFSTLSVEENVGKGVQSGVDVKTGSGVEGIDVTVCVGGTIVSDGGRMGVAATSGIAVGEI